MYHEYAYKIHLLRMRAINVNALSNYNVNFYSNNADTSFWIGSGFGQSRSDPDFSAGAH